jgi:hypothetical protein
MPRNKGRSLCLARRESWARIGSLVRVAIVHMACLCLMEMKCG